MNRARCSLVLAVLVLMVPGFTRGESPTLPVVVLIGDSIRLGYAPVVAERLAGAAEVISVAENGGDSRNVRAHLSAWAIATKAAVIHFNAGLHDLKVDPESGAPQIGLDDYRANLREIVARLERETSARLIFATTTPVLDVRHQAAKPFLRREADVRRYNEAALGVMKTFPAVAVDDLHTRALRLGLEAALRADGVHFTPEGNHALGEQVAAEITKALSGPPVTREAVCRWTGTAPTIDGKLDDSAWTLAEVIDRFPAYWKNAEYGPGTRARLVWDEEALYFAATMTDAELRSFGTKRNDTLWEGDVFELFFKPDGARPAYYEFQVNPRSLILELAFAKRGDDFATLAARPPLGMKAVALVDGTLDRAGDRDRGWTAEGRIPWTVFAPTGGRPERGAAWRFALCRYDYGPEGTAPVLMSSAPLSRPSFHRHEDYGLLRFQRAP